MPPSDTFEEMRVVPVAPRYGSGMGGPSRDYEQRTSVELFAGGGGLAMAVHRAAFRPLLFNEFNEPACRTLLASGKRTLTDDGLVRIDETTPKPPAPGEPAPLYPKDVRQLDLSAFEGMVDILAGGPPCQPFSAGGVAKGDEDRRNMFPALFKAVREMRPKAVLCENVRGLLRPSFAEYFRYIQNELKLPFEKRDDDARWQDHNAHLTGILDELSPDDSDPDHYKLVVVPVNAADYGVPQIRNRVVIVAFRSDLGINVDTFEKFVKMPQFSENALYRSMQDEDGPYWQRHPEVPAHLRDEVRARVPKVPKKDDCAPWRTLRDAIQGYGTEDLLSALPKVDCGRLEEKFDFGQEIGVSHHVGWPGARIYKGHTPNELDRPAKTVKAGVHGVPGGESVMLVDEPFRGQDGQLCQHRYMTVRETARVMTFPDEWVGSGPRGEQMRQLGNAVPVLLGEFFARAIADALAEVGS